MINIAIKTIKFYLETKKIPTLEDLDINNNELIQNKWSIFVTLYKDWEIHWSGWNINEIEKNIALEIIKNTIFALEDMRFENLNITDIPNLKIRIDKIIKREVLSNQKISELNPINTWLLVIKEDYEKLAVILPNISNKITNWKDFYEVLSKKLQEDFIEEKYHIYKIETQKQTNF